MNLDPAPLLAIILPGRTITQAANILNVAPRTIHRWQTGTSHITHHDADTYAIAAGHLPYELWPELLEDAVAAEQRTCDHPDCDRTYVPTRDWQRFCSDECREQNPDRRAMKARVNRDLQRRQYHTDEQYRAEQIAKARAYRAQYKDRINAQRRRARAEKRAA